MHTDGRTVPLLAGLACLAGVVATGVTALLDPVGQIHDAVTLQGFRSLDGSLTGTLAGHLAHSVDTARFVAIGALLASVALIRRRPRTALAVPAVMAAAVITSELLKPLLSTPRSAAAYGALAPGSWPSGHATAAMSVALCAVLVAPRRLRPVVAVAGAAYAAGVSYSLLILAWHMPSDVLGGFLVAATWTCVAVLALRTAQRRWPTPARAAGLHGLAPRAHALLTFGVAVLAAGVGALALLAWRHSLAEAYATGHRSFLAGALAIALLALALAAGLAALLSRGSGRAPRAVRPRRLLHG